MFGNTKNNQPHGKYIQISILSDLNFQPKLYCTPGEWVGNLAFLLPVINTNCFFTHHVYLERDGSDHWSLPPIKIQKAAERVVWIFSRLRYAKLIPVERWIVKSYCNLGYSMLK